MCAGPAPVDVAAPASEARLHHVGGIEHGRGILVPGVHCVRLGHPCGGEETGRRELVVHADQRVGIVDDADAAHARLQEAGEPGLDTVQRRPHVETSHDDVSGARASGDLGPADEGTGSGGHEGGAKPPVGRGRPVTGDVDGRFENRSVQPLLLVGGARARKADHGRLERVGERPVSFVVTPVPRRSVRAGCENARRRMGLSSGTRLSRGGAGARSSSSRRPAPSWGRRRSGRQGAKLVGAGVYGANTAQGMGVALSRDGNTLIVGGPTTTSCSEPAGHSPAGRHVDAAGAELVGTLAVGNAAKGSASLSPPRGHGRPRRPADNRTTGAVWVFIRSGSTWFQQGQKLAPSGGAGKYRMGTGLAISADGDTIAAGGPVDGSGAGAVWIFTRSAGVWSQQGEKLVGTGAAGAAAQGTGVALAADGNALAVGGPQDDSGAGAVWEGSCARAAPGRRRGRS